jgi:2-amino-4-hydroxy-6-hydroxymethyldihydropteridine diphosphokinase
VATRRCYLALGANIGNRLANLQAAVRLLAPAVTVDRVSSLYESAPVGPGGVAPYLNAACTGLTELSPQGLLGYVKEVEWTLGRRPGPHWGPRPADIDILLIEGVALAAPGLEVPHPRIAERPFVLRPLADLDPSLALPDGRTVGAAAEEAADSGLRRLAGADWLSRLTVMPSAMRPEIIVA